MTRTNNLDFLRFFAASIVVFGHGQAIAGFPQTQILGGSISVIGVMIFFTISGYLITESWERQNSLPIYLANRSLRIFPALVLVTILTAFLLGPAVTSLSISDYFRNDNFLPFLRNIALYTTYFLPGVFGSNPIQNAVNGSLWSLAPEFFCYLIVAGVGLVLPRTKIPAYTLIFVLLAAACFYAPSYKGSQIVLYATDVFQAASVMIYFMIGAIVRLAKIPLKPSMALALCALYFVIFPTSSPYVNLAFVWVFISYLALTIGFMSTPILRSWGRYGDLSYGIYLYSFPIQQTIAHFSSRL